MGNSVDPHEVETALFPAGGEGKSVESLLKALWESARRAGEALTRLREEKQQLQTLVTRLEKELQEVRAEIAQLKKHAGERPQGATLAGGDRDLLAVRVKELIAKLDAYL